VGTDLTSSVKGPIRRISWFDVHRPSIPGTILMWPLPTAVPPPELVPTHRVAVVSPSEVLNVDPSSFVSGLRVSLSPNRVSRPTGPPYTELRRLGSLGNRYRRWTPAAAASGLPPRSQGWVAKTPEKGAIWCSTPGRLYSPASDGVAS